MSQMIRAVVMLKRGLMVVDICYMEWFGQVAMCDLACRTTVFYSSTDGPLHHWTDLRERRNCRVSYPQLI